MKVFGAFCAFWENLSLRTKILAVVGLLGLLTGLPTSEMGWVWRWTREIFATQDCMNDLTIPLMRAAEQGDSVAVERAVSPDAVRQLKACGGNAIRHPDGTVSFLIHQYRRRPPDSK